jgi:hypothetical protein
MSVLTVLISSKIAVGVVTIGVLGVGGTAAATAAGALPAPLQEQAHQTIGAPAPADSTEPTDATEPTDSTEPTDVAAPTTTDSTETPASTSTEESTSTAATAATSTVQADTHGLCTAYLAGGLSVTSVAYVRLAADAQSSGSMVNGAADVSGYCAAAGVTKHRHTHEDSTSTSTETSTEQDANGTDPESNDRSGSTDSVQGGGEHHSKRGSTNMPAPTVSESTDVTAQHDAGSGDNGSASRQSDSGTGQGSDQQGD